jgi:hypothetical protein
LQISTHILRLVQKEKCLWLDWTVSNFLLRRILKAPNSACIESLYLELGITPIREIIKSRRINRLHYLANLNKEEMLYKFFITQWMYPVRNDWVHQVREDLADFNLEVDLDQLTKMSKNVFKRMVKKKLKEYSLGYLTTIKEKHSKMDQLVYPKLKIQNYLKDRKISVQAAKTLFRWRTRSALFDLFDEDIPSDISETVMKISKLREEIPLTPMGVLAPGSAHARPSAQPPIDVSENFPAHMSAESPSNISPNLEPHPHDSGDWIWMDLNISS